MPAFIHTYQSESFDVLKVKLVRELRFPLALHTCCSFLLPSLTTPPPPPPPTTTTTTTKRIPACALVPGICSFVDRGIGRQCLDCFRLTLSLCSCSDMTQTSCVPKPVSLPVGYLSQEIPLLISAGYRPASGGIPSMASRGSGNFRRMLQYLKYL